MFTTQHKYSSEIKGMYDDVMKLAVLSTRPHGTHRIILSFFTASLSIMLSFMKNDFLLRNLTRWFKVMPGIFKKATINYNKSGSKRPGGLGSTQLIQKFAQLA